MAQLVEIHIHFLGIEPMRSFVGVSTYFSKYQCVIMQGLLNRWTSQLDLGITAGALERAVSVHNST